MKRKNTTIADYRPGILLLMSLFIYLIEKEAAIYFILVAIFFQNADNFETNKGGKQ